MGDRPRRPAEAGRCRDRGRRGGRWTGHLRRAPQLRPALVHRAGRSGPDLRPAHAGIRPRATAADRVLHPGADGLSSQQAEHRRDRRAGGADHDAGINGVQYPPADSGAGHDALLLLAGHGHRAGADTDVHRPPPSRAQAAAAKQGVDAAQRGAGVDNDRAIQCRRRHAGEAFRRTVAGSGLFAGQAAKVRDIGVVQAMIGSTLFIALTLLASLSLAVVYGVGGDLVVRGAFRSARLFPWLCC